jgi:hypothetical protein
MSKNANRKRRQTIRLRKEKHRQIQQGKKSWGMIVFPNFPKHGFTILETKKKE